MNEVHENPGRFTLPKPYNIVSLGTEESVVVRNSAKVFPLNKY